MNEDYLWNKTGSDPELEKMENALRQFRYQQKTPPILPAQIMVQAENPARRTLFSGLRFKFALVGGTCLASVLLLIFGLWFQFSPASPDAFITATIPPQSITLTSDSPASDVPFNATKIEGTKPEPSKQPGKRRVYQVRKLVPTVIPPTSTTARVIKKKNPADVLSKEELYAYNQLMTALSITSSKLKLVQDKVQGLVN